MTMPAWVPALDRFGAALIGAVIGFTSVVWQTRGAIDAQTTAIASLRQTMDETIRPTLTKVGAHDAQIASHETRLAVIEHAVSVTKGQNQ